MCRYSMKMYKSHFACFKCRLAFKGVATCPSCLQPMTHMGMDFKAPPKRDKKWWANAEILARAGYTFSSCGCTGPGYGGKRDGRLSKRLKGAQAFVNQRLASQFPEELKSPKNGWRKPKIPAFSR